MEAEVVAAVSRRMARRRMVPRRRVGLQGRCSWRRGDPRQRSREISNSGGERAREDVSDRAALDSNHLVVGTRKGGTKAAPPPTPEETQRAASYPLASSGSPL